MEFLFLSGSGYGRQRWREPHRCPRRRCRAHLQRVGTLVAGVQSEGNQWGAQGQLQWVLIKKKYTYYLKLKFEEIGIHWPYFDEMNQSRKNMGLNEQTDGFENVARYFNGSIDFIGFDSNTLELTIKGWAVFQQSVPVDRVYFRFASGKEAEIVIRHRKNRDDVAKLLNMNQSAVGFEEKVKIDKSVVLEPEFSLVAKSDYQCRLYPLDVNRKYRSLFVSENDQ